MNNFYTILYDLINNYIFGGSIVDGSHTWEELIAKVLATTGIILAFALPFWVILRLFGFIGSRW